MVSSVAHIPGHAASHADRLKEEAYAVHHSGDLFYPWLCVRGFWGASLGPRSVPLVHDGSLCGTLTVPPGLGGYGLSKATGVGCALEGSGLYEVVGFRASTHVPLHDPPLTFTANLYETLQFRVE
ncbi:unnamed protein product [Calypogeia fissa]